MRSYFLQTLARELHNFLMVLCCNSAIFHADKTFYPCQATTTASDLMLWSPPARSQSKATMARMHVDNCRQNDTKSRRIFFPQQSLDTQYRMVFQFKYFGFVLSSCVFFVFCPSLLFSRRKSKGTGLLYWAASRHILF